MFRLDTISTRMTFNTVILGHRVDITAGGVGHWVINKQSHLQTFTTGRRHYRLCNRLRIILHHLIVVLDAAVVTSPECRPHGLTSQIAS